MKFAALAAATLLFAGSAVTGALAQPDGGMSPNGERGGGGAMRGACRADLEKLCPGVQPGGGRIGQCLREHQDQVSDSCKSALAAARARRQQMGPPADAPAPKAPS